MNDVEQVPEGFVRVEETGPFMTLLGPLYYRSAEAGRIIALRIVEHHLNRRGIAHGGMLATLADSALSVNISLSRKPRLPTVTVSLSTDFVASARAGDWVEAHVDIQKIGARLAYANCYLQVGSKRILRASGVFAVIQPSRPDESSDG
jgi:uncharacterized protein (TIGR00369 family)